ncbi:MAG: copper resistance protein NlpE N-terminal domain-containing protein [Tannerellaceae bacterium]|nr:copper resistance protein NlpE N-terminal domain-containing protein [Tannerellaceae bacterium]
MMKKNSIGFVLACVALVWGLCACNHRRSAETVGVEAPELVAEVDSSEAKEVYEGIMPVPAEEEMGVKIRLELFPDGTYKEYMEYTNRVGENLYQEGTYVRDEERLILDPATEGEKQYFRVVAGGLRSLNEYGQPYQDTSLEYLLLRQPLD